MARDRDKDELRPEAPLKGTNPMRFQKVAAVLTDLEADADFKRLLDTVDPASREFHRGIERVRRVCLSPAAVVPADRSVEESLQRLDGMCTGQLARFERFLLTALA